MPCCSSRIDGVRVGLAEDRDQHVAAEDLVLAGRLHVRRGALEDALEAERLLRRATSTPSRQLLELLVEELLELAASARRRRRRSGGRSRRRRRRAAARRARARAQELVAPPARFAARARARADLELAADPHAQASSMLQRSGNSCCARQRLDLRDTRLGDLARVDARDADAVLVHVQHDLHRVGLRVVEDRPAGRTRRTPWSCSRRCGADLVHPRLLQLRLGAGLDGRPGPVVPPIPLALMARTCSIAAAPKKRGLGMIGPGAAGPTL